MAEFERRKSVTPLDIFVTEAIVLPPGRNFYDQFPFQGVFRDAANRINDQTPAKEKERDTFLDIANMVTRSVESADETDQRNTAGFNRNTYIRTLLTRPSRIRDALMTAEQKKAYPLREYEGYDHLFKTLLINIFSELEPYPEWQTYISTNLLENRIYRQNGTRSNRPIITADDSVFSYLSWLDIRRQQQAIGRQFGMIQAIDMVFDGENPDTSRIVAKNWRIRRSKN